MGIIELNSKIGKQLEFTADKYSGFLWKRDKYIYISVIECNHKRQGDLNRLFDNILKAGYGIKVPSPLGLMELILQKKGFIKTYESVIDSGDCEVWVKEADNGTN